MSFLSTHPGSSRADFQKKEQDHSVRRGFPMARRSIPSLAAILTALGCGSALAMDRPAPAGFSAPAALVATFVNASGGPWTLKRVGPGGPEGGLVALDSLTMAPQDGLSLALELDGTTCLDLQDAGGVTACLIKVTHARSGEEPGGSIKVSYEAPAGQENLDRILQPQGTLTWVIAGAQSRPERLTRPPAGKRAVLGDLTPPRPAAFESARSGRRPFSPASPAPRAQVKLGPPRRLGAMAVLSPMKKDVKRQLDQARRALELARKAEIGADGGSMESVAQAGAARLEAEAARWVAEARAARLGAWTAGENYKLLARKQAPDGRRKRSLRRVALTGSIVHHHRQATTLAENLGQVAGAFDHLAAVQMRVVELVKGLGETRRGLDYAAKEDGGLGPASLVTRIKECLEENRQILAEAQESLADARATRAEISGLPAHAADVLEDLDGRMAELATDLAARTGELEALGRRLDPGAAAAGSSSSQSGPACVPGLFH
jgi:hypothetical protein